MRTDHVAAVHKASDLLVSVCNNAITEHKTQISQMEEMIARAKKLREEPAPPTIMPDGSSLRRAMGAVDENERRTG